MRVLHQCDAHGVRAADGSYMITRIHRALHAIPAYFDQQIANLRQDGDGFTLPAVILPASSR